MKIFNSYPETKIEINCLTIGIFDGVHLGHQAIIKRLTQKDRSAIFTFSNHPIEVLQERPVTYLTTLSHRLSLFKNLGVENAIVLPFTREFSQQSSRTFLEILKKHFDFKDLILGHDSTIGHDQNNNLFELSHELNFNLEYLSPVKVNGIIVSSSAIRERIRLGKLEEITTLLGRPYSIEATVESNKKIRGFYTANLPVQNLALPPSGVYAVLVKLDEESLPAVAHLGSTTPTLHENREPIFEVYLFNDQKELAHKSFEIIFIRSLA